eukprot:227210-Pelagomonas_calceolata.AAC.2
MLRPCMEWANRGHTCCLEMQVSEWWQWPGVAMARDCKVGRDVGKRYIQILSSRRLVEEERKTTEAVKTLPSSIKDKRIPRVKAPCILRERFSTKRRKERRRSMGIGRITSCTGYRLEIQKRPPVKTIEC